MKSPIQCSYLLMSLPTSSYFHKVFARFSIPLSWGHLCLCTAGAAIVHLKKQCHKKLEENMEVLAINRVWYQI